MQGKHLFPKVWRRKKWRWIQWTHSGWCALVLRMIYKWNLFWGYLIVSVSVKCANFFQRLPYFRAIKQMTAISMLVGCRIQLRRPQPQVICPSWARLHKPWLAWWPRARAIIVYHKIIKIRLSRIANLCIRSVELSDLQQLLLAIKNTKMAKA